MAFLNRRRARQLALFGVLGGLAAGLFGGDKDIDR